MRKKLVKKKIIQDYLKFLKPVEINNNIGIIIPITSRGRKYRNIEDIDFFKILYSSFKKFRSLTNNYNYNFYLGYDNDDEFYLKNIQEIENHFNIIKMNNESIKLIEIKNLKGKVGAIWSILADTAIKENNSFLYQIGDDIKFLNSSWEDIFIKNLSKNNFLGVTGPLDLNNRILLTQSFVHKLHVEIFGTYFPPEIINWFIDDWIMNVYGVKQDKRIKVINSGGPNRYLGIDDKSNYINILKRDRIKLEEYVKKENEKFKSLSE